MDRTSPRRRVAVLSAALALLSAGGLTACGDDDDGGALPAEELDGRSFVVTEVEGHEIVESSSITITFEGNTMSVDAGCNTMHGGYTLDADGMLLAPTLAQTMIACDDALTAQDQWLNTFFAAGAEASLDGDTLTLTTPDGSITAEQSSD